MLDKDDGYPIIVRKILIGDIKKNTEKIFKFVSLTERGPGARKTLKNQENHVLEDVLLSVSGNIICEKARTFRRQIKNPHNGFNTSRGWLGKFTKRHGIHV